MREKDTRPREREHKYSIRKDGKVCMAWDDPGLTYPRETLRAMKAAGYRLYVDGRLQR